jgi:predicted nucleic acid-binding protein
LTTSSVFVDTNVILYAFDPREPDKQSRSRDWLRACWLRRCGRISNQVVNEFYANARGRFSRFVSPEEARVEVRRYQQWKPWSIDFATVETAWAVESRFQVSYWDALMVAAAQHMGCSLLLTEDLQHGQRFEQLRVINPFLADPEILDFTE